MDEKIDLTKIECIPNENMLAITNQYIISSTDHINKYKNNYACRVADFA